MNNNNTSKFVSSLEVLTSNIDEAKRISEENGSLKLAAVVSGNKTTCLNWKQRLKSTGSHIFNRDKSTLLLSLEEKIGKKDKEGNFFGTLLAYRYMKEEAHKRNLKC